MRQTADLGNTLMLLLQIAGFYFMVDSIIYRIIPVDTKYSVNQYEKLYQSQAVSSH